MKQFLLMLGLACVPAGANAAVDPSSVKLTIYKIAVSASTDCSNPTVIANYPNGVEFDFASARKPRLANGYLAPGTYPCVMMQMSDVIKFTPAQSTGSCTAGVEYTRDVCRASSGTYQPVNTNANGTISFGSSTACTGTQATPTNDRPMLFLSTASNSTSGNTFLQPTSASNGIQLNGAFVVTASSVGTFVVDFRGKIDGSNSDCDCNAPVFGLR